MAWIGDYTTLIYSIKNSWESKEGSPTNLRLLWNFAYDAGDFAIMIFFYEIGYRWKLLKMKADKLLWDKFPD